MGSQQAFMTVKGHKDNFPNTIPCRPIKLAESNLSLVSEPILERINNKIRYCTKLNQWRNTQTVNDWFCHLQDKQSLPFLVFDIIDFYPSISELLLLKALDFAKQFDTISSQEKEIIMHSRKSLLFDKNEPWAKKDNANLFDVSMGSFDGTDVCELVGLLALSKLNEKCDNNKVIGLYRDNGLAALRHVGPRSGNRIRKIFCDVFAKLGLKTTAQANLHVVNFLNITLNLKNGKHMPYRKPDDPQCYANSQSNHPPAILKQLPAVIGKRVSSLSCDLEEFNKAAPIYDSALRSSGIASRLEYSHPATSSKHARRNRSGNILRFNPPYSMNVRSNVGKHFLGLLDKHFPESHVLESVVNRNNCKVSYSCMDNMQTVVKQHNVRVLRSADVKIITLGVIAARKHTVL